MTQLNTEHFLRCIKTLERAFEYLNQSPKDSELYDIYRAACVKEFEIILEQANKLLKKSLKPYFVSARQVDELYFKDVFRHAAKHGLIDTDAVERWLQYRDNRNDTAHDYGVGFAESTLQLLAKFIEDAYRINTTLNSL